MINRIASLGQVQEYICTVGRCGPADYFAMSEVRAIHIKTQRIVRNAQNKLLEILLL